MSNDTASHGDLSAPAGERELIYTVVINDEEQYSIWLEDRDLPAGWHAVGKVGTKADCLGYIEEVWNDQRPLSLRRWMDEQAAMR